MGKYSIDSATLTGIADAIREKAKTTGAIKTSSMAESILAIKGGLALDVVTASALPGAVVDGQIVIITDTAAGTVYIDTDEPANLMAGDLWVEVAGGGVAALEMSEESPFLRNGLSAAYQLVGSALLAREGYIGINGKWTQFAWALPPAGTALNDLTWEEIATISAAGLAKRYFAIGDAKQIVINGKVGSPTFSNTTAWAFIVGIDHNAEYEGEHSIHFQIGKTAQTGGSNVAYIDSKYSNQTTNSGCFTMRTETYYNTGGWAKTKMRNEVLGNNGTPIVPYANSFIAALPSDLRAVMKGVTKYTDNAGGASLSASSVTATTDYLWLPSEYEVFGSQSYANAAEQAYQKQYDYYASGNSKVFKKYNDTGTDAMYWLRSPAGGNSNEYFCATKGSSTSYYNAKTSYAICPCFCV